MTDELAYTPIRRLAGMLRGRSLSPVELAEYCLGRLERLGPRYNALVTLTADRALELARNEESEIAQGRYRGLLQGIPWGAKDLLATSGGIPTTWGAAPFRDQQFEYDATVVARLEESGAPLAAKLAMIELAGGMGYTHPDASLTGPPKNPWDAGRWTGGSSSGSGAAVAAGMVPFAIGSETWGSILLPAASCGLSGLRPTYGRVSRHGAMALCWTLDKLGPLCLTADDCGIVLEAISGPDPRDPTTHAEGFSYDPKYHPGRRYRIGVLKGVLDGAQDAVKRNFEAALDSLADMADFEEIEFPDLPYAEVTSTILMVEAASAFAGFRRRGRPPTPGGSRISRAWALRQDCRPGDGLRQGAQASRRDGPAGGCGDVRVRRAGRTDVAEHGDANRPGLSERLGGVDRDRRPYGRSGQWLRSARHIGPQRIRPRRLAHRNPVYVQSLRRERVHRDRPRIPGPDRLARQTPLRAVRLT